MRKILCFIFPLLTWLFFCGIIALLYRGVNVMLNFLLTVYNSGVSSPTTSGDNIPGGGITGLDFDTAAFVLGLVVGAIATLILIGIVKYAKFIIKDNQRIREEALTNENQNSEKSDK